MIKKFLTDAVLSLVMDKRAKDKLRAMRGEAVSTKQADDERQAHIRAIRENLDKVVTPDRQKLIQDAMAVHRAQSKIIDDLGDEEKRKLYAIAVKTLLRGETPPSKG